MISKLGHYPIQIRTIALKYGQSRPASARHAIGFNGCSPTRQIPDSPAGFLESCRRHPALAPIGGLSLRPANYPPGKPSSNEFRCSGGNPLVTWRTMEMISCTISPRGAAGSTSQQISHRSADLRLSVVRARKFPIVLMLSSFIFSF
jgi:hypothetical protein